MENALLPVLTFLVLVLWSTFQLKLERTDRRIARLDRKVNLLLGHLGIEEFGAAEFEAVAALVRQGKKIEAIKLHRQITGSDLKEAKEAVEAMR